MPYALVREGHHRKCPGAGSFCEREELWIRRGKCPQAEGLREASARGRGQPDRDTHPRAPSTQVPRPGSHASERATAKAHRPAHRQDCHPVVGPRQGKRVKGHPLSKRPSEQAAAGEADRRAVRAAQNGLCSPSSSLASLPLTFLLAAYYGEKPDTIPFYFFKQRVLRPSTSSVRGHCELDRTQSLRQELDPHSCGKRGGTDV